MDSSFPKKCCVCGRTLPNKYAVAGTVPSGGGEAAYCAWHWNARNRGGKPQNQSPDTRPATQDRTAAADTAMQTETPIPATVNLTVEQKKTAARAALDAISKLGAGVAGLVKKLSGVQDPQEMIDSFGAALDANRARRAPLDERHEALFREIAEKKKVWQSAPAARKRLLELELRTLLSEWKGLERQLAAFYENERTLVAVRTRVEEIVALEMRKVSEKQIDRLADKLDDAVSDADDVAGAVSDLENAGKRRDSEAASESLADALAGFDLEGGEADAAPGRVADPPAAAPASSVADSPAGLADLLP